MGFGYGWRRLLRVDRLVLVSLSFDLTFPPLSSNTYYHQLAEWPSFSEYAEEQAEVAKFDLVQDAVVY